MFRLVAQCQTLIPMTNDTLLRQANEQLELNEFEIAAALFRQAAFQNSPTNATLANLIVADDQQRLKMLRELVEKYPMSTPCRHAEIGELVRSGHVKIAIAKCSQALNDFPEDDNQFLFRFSRLKAGTSARQFDEVWAADFQWLWNSDFPVASRFRKGLIRELKANHCASSLIEIAKMDWLSPTMKNLIDSKLESTRFMSELEHQDHN